MSRHGLRLSGAFPRVLFVSISFLLQGIFGTVFHDDLKQWNPIRKTTMLRKREHDERRTTPIRSRGNPSAVFSAFRSVTPEDRYRIFVFCQSADWLPAADGTIIAEWRTDVVLGPVVRVPTVRVCHRLTKTCPFLVFARQLRLLRRGERRGPSMAKTVRPRKRLQFNWDL